MQKLTELDLPYLKLEDPALCRNPYPYFAGAREQHPWLAKSVYGVVVHEFDAIQELLSQMDDKLRPSFDGYIEYFDAHGTPWGRFTKEMIMCMSEEDHQKLRSAFAEKFTPRFANSLRTLMRSTVTSLLDEWIPKGGFDFEQFASYFPVSVMFNVIGAPVREIGEIRQSLETIGLGVALTKDQLPVIQNAYLQLEGLAERLMSDRRANPNSGRKEDLLSLLIDVEDSGAISTRQLVDMLIFLFVAGYDTSKNMLTYIMYTLLDRPEIYERCANDIDYCKKVVEETFRYFNPSITPRLVTEDLTYRDVLIPKDTTLLFTLNISGRDPRAFENPDEFNPDRPIESDARHLAFGRGKHMCLGQHIARVQIQEGLHQICKRIKNPRLDGQIGWRPFASTWGLKGLPIAFASS